MRSPRWPILAALPVVGLAIAGAGIAAGAGPRTMTTHPECQPGLAHASAPAAGPGWWRLDPVLDRAGRLVGQDLRVGGEARHQRIGLPAESFASGPTGGRIVVGADDGLESSLSLLDIAAGCRIPVATEAAVVRRAVLDQGGTALYEFRVDRRTRGDLGVWRRDLVGPADTRPILAPPAADDQFGRTWTTELGWSDDGLLIVASCGAFACRTRLVDTADGSVVSIAEPDLGEPLGVAEGRLVSYLACRGLPCPIVAVDLATGHRRELSAGAGLAVLVRDDRRTLLAIEPPDRIGSATIVDLDGTSVGRIDLADSERIVGPVSRSGSSVAAPAGWLAIGPSGRLDVTGPTLVGVHDGRRASAVEVAR
jgi:hypothetical protein